MYKINLFSLFYLMSKMSEIHYTDFNALNGTHVKDYRNICIVVSCINVEDVKDI